MSFWLAMTALSGAAFVVYAIKVFTKNEAKDIG